MNMRAVLIAGLLAISLEPVHAESLATNGAWHPFDVDQTISMSNDINWIDVDGNPLSFEFELTEAAYLTVVDGGYAGDRFQVYDNGVLLGQTSNPANSYPDSVGLDFEAALADSNFSRASFMLTAGLHSVTGWLNLSALDAEQLPLNATVGAVRLTAVPLPAAAWLYMTGAALVGLMSRRRNSHV